MSPFRLAVLSLLRRRVPTLITVASIAISVACSGILLRLYHLSASRFSSLGRGWEAVVGAKAGGIEILLNSLNGEGPFPDFLPAVLFDSLRAMQAVQFEDGHTTHPDFIRNISPLLYFANLEEYRALGTDESFAQNLGPNALANGRWATTHGEVVLGHQVAARLRRQVNDSVTLSPSVPGSGEVKLNVVGVLQSTESVWDRTLFATVAQAQEVIGANPDYLREHSIWGAKVLHYFLINLRPNGFAPLEALINKRTIGQVVRVEQAKAELEQLTSAGKGIGIFVSGFIILLSSLSVSSMLITRFDAMGVQLAVLRAIGHSRGEIAAWLMWEGLLLGFVGCALGAVLDGLGFPILRHLLGSALPPPEVVDSFLFESLPIWTVALLATVMAIFIPLVRLYRQDVHQALKS